MTARPYSTEEIAAIADTLMQPMSGKHPEIVVQTIMLLTLVEWLDRYKDDEDFPPVLTSLLRAAGPALRGMLRACEQGPYDGMPVA